MTKEIPLTAKELRPLAKEIPLTVKELSHLTKETPLMEKVLRPLAKEIPLLVIQTFRQVSKTTDYGKQSGRQAHLSLGLADQPRPTINDTVGADKKLTSRSTQAKRPRQPTQYAHNSKPRQPKHRPKLVIESAALAPNCPDDHSDSTPTEKQQQVTWGCLNAECCATLNCITFYLHLCGWTLERI